MAIFGASHPSIPLAGSIGAMLWLPGTSRKTPLVLGEGREGSCGAAGRAEAGGCVSDAADGRGRVSPRPCPGSFWDVSGFI
ncbi:uncharacterized protein LOC142361388 isoform X3 [Opisthocomus hoazin]|uniref:uncharacterized protein LOC142361388 isoform X3 n=1 Tax=Opisthocomus hoazin TaxID=30419 RepID=UPI003F52ABD9